MASITNLKILANELRTLYQNGNGWMVDKKAQKRQMERVENEIIHEVMDLFGEDADQDAANGH